MRKAIDRNVKMAVKINELEEDKKEIINKLEFLRGLLKGLKNI